MHRLDGTSLHVKKHENREGITHGNDVDDLSAHCAPPQLGPPTLTARSQAIGSSRAQPEPNPTKSDRIQSSRAESGHTGSRRVTSGHVGSRRVNIGSSRVKSRYRASQPKSGQLKIKSHQLKSNTSHHVASRQSRQQVESKVSLWLRAMRA